MCPGAGPRAAIIIHVRAALLEKETDTMNVQLTGNDRTAKSKKRSGWTEPQHRRPTTRRTFLKPLSSPDSSRGQGYGPRSDRSLFAQAHLRAPAPQPRDTRRLSLALQGGGAFG